MPSRSDLVLGRCTGRLSDSLPYRLYQRIKITLPFFPPENHPGVLVVVRMIGRDDEPDGALASVTLSEREPHTQANRVTRTITVTNELAEVGESRDSTGEDH